MVTQPDVTLLIPARDEALNLPSLLARVPAGVRVVVINNGSRDDTAAVAAAAGATVLDVPIAGYGRAILAGLASLADAPPAWVGVIDADHADDPANLPLLLAPLLEGRADAALAWRRPEPGALTPAQLVGNTVAKVGIYAITGRRYHDLGPFRVMSWQTWTRLALTDLTWGFNVEQQIKLARLGLRVEEVPLPYRRRAAGQSKISGTLTGVARAGARILVTLARHAVDRSGAP